MGEFKLSSIEDALEDFKAGQFVIVVDDEDRENGELHAEERTRRALRTYHPLAL